jgi:hypothetical protein
MATSKKKSSATSKKTPSKKTARKKSTKKGAKKSAKKSGKKNKLGVKNSLVENINARKSKGVSRPKKKSTVSKKSYGDMQNNWNKSK